MIEMSTMKGIIKVMPYGDEDCALPFVEASGGELLGACAASFGLPDLLHYFSLQSLSLFGFQSSTIMGFLGCLIFNLF
jgi:hypothetical protein